MFDCPPCEGSPGEDGNERCRQGVGAEESPQNPNESPSSRAESVKQLIRLWALPHSGALYDHLVY